MSFFNADILVSGTDGLLLKDLGTDATTPNSGFGTIYVNSDVLYFKTDLGTATNLLSGGISFDGTTANGILTYKDSDEATVESNLTYDGSDLLITSSTSAKPILTIQNTHTGSTSGTLKFINDKGTTGADNDICGTITFYGDDDNQDNIEFARIEGIVADASNGDECGKLNLSVSLDGTLSSILSMKSSIGTNVGSGFTPNQPIKFYIYEYGPEIITLIAINLNGIYYNGTSETTSIIGNDTGTNAYFYQLSTSVNGIVNKIEMSCLEQPNVNTDIGIHNSSDSLTKGQAVNGDKIIFNFPLDTDGTLGTTTSGTSLNLSSKPNLYLYGNNLSGAGSYSLGKIVIKIFGIKNTF